MMYAITLASPSQSHNPCAAPVVWQTSFVFFQWFSPPRSGWSRIKSNFILSTFSDKFIKATNIFDPRLLRRRLVGGSGRHGNVVGGCRGRGRRGDCGAPVRPAPAQQDAVLPPPVPPHALRAPAAADTADNPSSIPPLLFGAAVVLAVGRRRIRRRARYRQPLPLLPVAEAAVEHGLEGVGELGERTVGRQAEGVYEVDLHCGQAVHLVAVHAIDRLHPELALLEVALVEELIRDEPRHLLLDGPGLRDGRQVAAGHHHPAEERAVRVVAPVEQVVVDDGERLGPAPEVDGQVGGEDRVLQYGYHTFEFILGMNKREECCMKMASFTSTVKTTRVMAICEAYLREIRQDLVPLGVEYHEALVKVVVLHRRGGVEPRQRRAGLYLEGVVGAAVVQIVAEASDHQRETLDLEETGRLFNYCSARVSFQVDRVQ